MDKPEAKCPRCGWEGGRCEALRNDGSNGRGDFQMILVCPSCRRAPVMRVDDSNQVAVVVAA